jgi:CRISPR-associated protein Cas6
MYWEEDEKVETPVVTDEVIDLVFGVQCRCLPVDHVYALSQAVQGVLPWLASEPVAGVHSVHVAASSNGWMRPDNPQALLHLSRRTRLVVRVPKHRVEDAQKLEGETLDIAGHAMTVKNASVRPLSTLTTLFARYLATAENLSDEAAVLDWVASQLREIDIKPRKMLCGTEHVIETPQGPLRTRSLMIADLEVDESLRLQEQGLGPYRHLGCGLFIPHKGIDDVRDDSD